jgi:hypothetical protein
MQRHCQSRRTNRLLVESFRYSARTVSAAVELPVLALVLTFMTSMPRALQIMGIQSTNLTCTSEPFRGEWEKVEASIKKKKPRENCKLGQYDRRDTHWVGSLYQSARQVDACCSGGSTVEPCRLREAKETLGGHLVKIVSRLRRERNSRGFRGR